MNAFHTHWKRTVTDFSNNKIIRKIEQTSNTINELSGIIITK